MARWLFTSTGAPIRRASTSIARRASSSSNIPRNIPRNIPTARVADFQDPYKVAATQVVPVQARFGRTARVRKAVKNPKKTAKKAKEKIMAKYAEIVKNRKEAFNRRIAQSAALRAQLGAKGKSMLTSAKTSAAQKAAVIRQTKAYKKAKKKVEKAKTGLQKQIDRRRSINQSARLVRTQKKIDADNVKRVKDLKKRGLEPSETEKRYMAGEYKKLQDFTKKLDEKTSKSEKFARKLIKNPKKTLGGVTIGGLAVADVMGAADGVLPDLGVQLLEKMKK